MCRSLTQQRKLIFRQREVDDAVHTLCLRGGPIALNIGADCIQEVDLMVSPLRQQIGYDVSGVECLVQLLRCGVAPLNGSHNPISGFVALSA